MAYGFAALNATGLPRLPGAILPGASPAGQQQMAASGFAPTAAPMAMPDSQDATAMLQALAAQMGGGDAMGQRLRLTAPQGVPSTSSTPPAATGTPGAVPTQPPQSFADMMQAFLHARALAGAPGGMAANLTQAPANVMGNLQGAPGNIAAILSRLMGARAAQQPGVLGGGAVPAPAVIGGP